MEKIKNPVVFVPGLFISETDFYQKYSGLPDFAEQFCETFIIQKFEPGKNLEERSASMIATLNQFNNFHAVGHSRGGIDLRYALDKMPELQKFCQSLTTLSTPHRGSPLADLFFDEANGPAEFLLHNILGIDPAIEEQVKELTTSNMTALDKKMGNPACPTYCIPFVIDQAWKAGALDRASYTYLNAKSFTENDGVVQLSSQLFGHQLDTMHGSHIAETAGLRYGLPFQTIWKDVFREVFGVMKAQEEI